MFTNDHSSIPRIIRSMNKTGLYHEGNALEPCEKNGVVWLEAPALAGQDWLVHAFSTRIGGVSTGELSSMNMSFARESNKDNVRENYRRILEAVGIDEKGMVLTHQTHTNRIRKVTSEDAGKGLLRERDYTDVDGLITNVPGLTLAVFMSDCVPVMAVDPEHHAIGAAHSGWRGTVTGIGSRLIQKMHAEYGSNPDRIICIIGPSICQECYEVTEDVIDAFKDAYDEQTWPALFYQTDETHYQLNLWEACRQNFLTAGVSTDHITVTDICTRCNPDLLYSHRRQHGKQGNLAGFLGIR